MNFKLKCLLLVIATLFTFSCSTVKKVNLGSKSKDPAVLLAKFIDDTVFELRKYPKFLIEDGISPSGLADKMKAQSLDRLRPVSESVFNNWYRNCAMGEKEQKCSLEVSSMSVTDDELVSCFRAVFSNDLDFIYQRSIETFVDGISNRNLDFLSAKNEFLDTFNDAIMKIVGKSIEGIQDLSSKKMLRVKVTNTCEVLFPSTSQTEEEYLRERDGISSEEPKIETAVDLKKELEEEELKQNPDFCRIARIIQILLNEQQIREDEIDEYKNTKVVAENTCNQKK